MQDCAGPERNNKSKSGSILVYLKVVSHPAQILCLLILPDGCYHKRSLWSLSQLFITVYKIQQIFASFTISYREFAIISGVYGIMIELMNIAL